MTDAPVPASTSPVDLDQHADAAADLATGPIATVGYGVDQALAYVDDTVSMRTPPERVLAAEVHALRAMLTGAARREAAANARAAAAETAGVDLALERLVAAWAAIPVDTADGQCARFAAQLAHGADLVVVLDRLAGV